uniref:Uncharacterized protein n=1 Tax=Cannabis sativa TaxID=3483 RepID=A0A803NQG8_CANSA
MAIPLARPLFLPQVTAAFAVGDLEFEIMAPKAPKSKTPQNPNVTFEAELSESKLLPPTFLLNDEGYSTSDSSRIGAWSVEHVKAGAALPHRQYFKDFCNYLGIAPFQLVPDSYRIFSF